jgi:hypothetical protein
MTTTKAFEIATARYKRIIADDGVFARLNTSANLSWNSSSDAYSSEYVVSRVTKVHTGMRRCLLNSSGVVNYYLDPDDSTKKIDGTSANLDGTDGYVMVEIPKFYYKQVKIGNVTTWDVSDREITGYTLHPAFIKNGVEVSYRYMGAYDACLLFTRSVTAVADAGGGSITFTTSETHPLYVGDIVTISGTTDYNDTYTVTVRDSDTTFTAVGTFTSTQTGTATGYVSGKNIDDASGIIQTGTDKLASVAGIYPLVGVLRSECRSLAANNGTGWRQPDFWLSSAIQMLYLVEYGTFNSQVVLGQGNVNSDYIIGSSTNQNDSPHTIAGASNTWGNSSTNGTQPSAGAKPGTAFMSYRGIENFFGNCWNWVDGFNIGIVANHDIWVSNDDTVFADNTSTNYVNLPGTMAAANGFVRDLLDISGVFLPSNTSGGSSSTFITDNYFQDTGNRVALLGGAANNGLSAGAFFWALNLDSGLRNRSLGARVCF